MTGRKTAKCRVTGAVGRAVTLTAGVQALGTAGSRRTFKRGETVFALHDWKTIEIRRGMHYVCPRAWLDAEEGKRWIERC